MKRRQIPFRLLLVILPFIVLSPGCKKDNAPNDLSDIIGQLEVIPNPSTYAPLTALVRFNSIVPASAQIRIPGRNGIASDVIQDFPTLTDQFEIPVLGLYANTNNEVKLTLFDAAGVNLGTQTLFIQTDILIPEMPDIVIQKRENRGLQPGFNLVNYFGHNGTFLPQRPFMFDEFGDIRWYLNFANHPTLTNLFYDNGLNVLANGNFICGDGNSGALYEISRLGEIVNSWSLQGYRFHHHVIEKPNGNFLVTVNDPSKSTVEDVILEINRANGLIVQTWDLNESLDNSRRAWDTDLADLNVDWFHANGIEFNPADEAIIVSGRTQGVVKLSARNEVIWILAPHKDWGNAGNGADLNQFLLQPLDAEGMPITDPDVLSGNTNHPDFEWPWYQHSPILLPNGNIMVFDNGDNRNYSGSEKYSRAVEYAVDEVNRTIQQIWSYGKERGVETYSRIVSKVLYFPEQDHVLFTPGAINYQEPHGRVIEINKKSGDVLFEAAVYPPVTPFNIAFHNVQRVGLYPN